ncbi:hypothetical protein KVR01_006506 [Diaporthe batatas]|uniref:uncharacterized protein n=1 Tax=Diaporthe batatas TaxID=748121 RepID=UPI001D04FD75|nr:uncharacterized protein KVR01_006506 [Diaporthe batatas]KAG8163209.1 hypothetical protein KVR01_006506 [Diaporthe batatas]
MMQGEAGGDGGRVRRNTRKRDLDDASMSKTVDNLSSKRRLTTAGATGQHDDETASNSTKLESHRAKRKSTSQPPKPQLDTLQFSLRSAERPALSAPRMHGPVNPPFSNDSAARLSGPPGATGASWGTTPSGYGHHKSNQHRPTTQIPTSPTTSSDASSIPARSNRISPFATPKHETRASPHSLAASEEPGHNAKFHQELKGRSHNTRRGATGPQVWQSERRDEALPVSRLNGTKELPHAITSSDDDSYVEEREEAQDSDDDAIPTTRQRTARLGARGSTMNLSEIRDDDLNDEQGVERSLFRKTPSGRDYHQLPDNISSAYSPKFALFPFALFPDGYKTKSVLGRKPRRFPCPVRTCPDLCHTLEKLDNHFKSHHARSEFNDNLDRDATLEYIRSRAGGASNLESIVVSQNPRHLASDEQEKWIPYPQLDSTSSSASGDTEQDSAATAPSELERAMAESKVWAYVAPLVPKSWAASITYGLEKRAFIQAISLPLRNEMDMEWLAGTKGSHQRLYRALMSVILQAVGVVAHCKPCDSKIPERRRNCKILPPEAAGMLELQEVYGSQCVNCFFFQASRPCEFPDSSTTTKQTPIPVPVPPVPRAIPVIERSHDSPPSKSLRSAVSSRQFVPPYSLYKAQKIEKPISESPVPIPSFAIHGPSRQSQFQDSPDVSPVKAETKPLRRSNRVAKADSEVHNSSSVVESHTTDESRLRSAGPDASNDGSSNATLTSTGSNTEAFTEAASNLSCGDISTPRLASRMFSLFGDISRLPSEEQAALWHQMQQMSAMLQTGGSGVSKASGIPLLPGPSAAADEWEIAPGKLVVDGRPMAFSTSFLRREVISVAAAQQLSPNHRVLIKSIAALHQLPIEPEKGWKCTVSVIRGVLKMKAGDVEARIGQGGAISVEKKCIITNVLHKEATMQVCWVEEV